MRILFLASGEFAQPTLRWLAQSGHEVPLLLTQPARGSGRGRRVTRTPAQALADEWAIPVLAVEDVNSPETVAQIRSQNADLGLVIAFGQKLGPTLLTSLPAGFINLHASLLPKYRGAAPINWAVVHGEIETGCTVFRIVERMDAGPILAMDETPIGETETAGELHDRLAELGVQTVKKALEQFAGGKVPTGVPQDEGQKTLAPKLKKTDGLIRFDRPAREVVRHIHGMTPWPGAHARFQAQDGRFEDVTLMRARVVAETDGTKGAPPGTWHAGQGGVAVAGRAAWSDPKGQALGASPTASLRETVPPQGHDGSKFCGHDPGTLHAGPGGLHLAVGGGSIEILEIKPSSGRLMSWKDYVNGRHAAAGDRFIALPGP